MNKVSSANGNFFHKVSIINGSFHSSTKKSGTEKFQCRMNKILVGKSLSEWLLNQDIMVFVLIHLTIYQFWVMDVTWFQNLLFNK